MSNDLITMDALVGSLRAELAQARETNQRLQRRCHAAEGLVAKLKLVEGRPQTEQGRSFGRALANYAAAQYMRERDEARSFVEELVSYALTGGGPLPSLTRARMALARWRADAVPDTANKSSTGSEAHL